MEKDQLPSLPNDSPIPRVPAAMPSLPNDSPMKRTPSPEDAEEMPTAVSAGQMKKA